MKKLAKSSLMKEVLVRAQQGAPRDRKPHATSTGLLGPAAGACRRGRKGHNDQKRLEKLSSLSKCCCFGVSTPAPLQP